MTDSTRAVMARRVRGLTPALALLLLAPQARAQEPSSVASSKSPIRDSVEPVVEELLRREREACARAIAEGVPCFPVSVEAGAPRPEYSVAESLRQWKAPGAGGAARPGATSPYGTPIVGVTFDPVCAARSALRSLRGRGDTFYLYRVWGEAGEEQVILRETPLEPGPWFRYELLSKIDGVCEAVAAWRKAERATHDRNAAASKAN